MPDTRDFESGLPNEVSEPREKDFSLDDIVREYGGWTEADIASASTESDGSAGSSQEIGSFTLNVVLNNPEEMSQDASEAQTDILQEEPEEEMAPPQLKILPKKPSRKDRTSSGKSPQQLLSESKNALRLLPIRTYLTGFLTLVAALLTLWQGMEWSLPISPPSVETLSFVLLGLFLLCSFLSLDVLIRGLRQAFTLHFNLESSLLITAIAVTADGFFAFASDRVPLFAPICLSLFLADFGRLRRLSSDVIQLRNISAEADNRELLFRIPKLWHNTDCLIHLKDSRNISAGSVKGSDGCERALRVYCPVVTLIAIVLAVMTSTRQHQNFVWVLSVLLTGSLPVMGFFCYASPACTLSQRLSKSGSALLGWEGVRNLCGSRYLIMGARDLFPNANVSFNGLKVYGQYRVNQVVACAGTMMIAAGSELETLFSQLMQEYGVRTYPVGSFRRYEGGGYGAEMGGDVVLTGSQRFMHLMGIQIPSDLKVKQALFLSINGELAGVFALSYKSSSSVRTALQSIQRSRGLVPLLAARDFLISPQLLAQKYKISSDSIEFPAVSDRTRFSEMTAGTDAMPAAVLNKETPAGYANTVLGARALNSVTRWGIVFCYMAGIAGLLMMILLTRTGATTIASASNLLLYLVLWLIPSALLGLWVRFV